VNPCDGFMHTFDERELVAEADQNSLVLYWLVLATSDICSGNWPVLHDGESMLASAVLTRRNIRWPKGQFPLPDSPFLGARDLMER
jgi:hypothetical protein